MLDSSSPEVNVVLAAKKNPIKIAPRVNPRQTFGVKNIPIKNGSKIS